MLISCEVHWASRFGIDETPVNVYGKLNIIFHNLSFMIYESSPISYQWIIYDNPLLSWCKRCRIRSNWNPTWRPWTCWYQWNRFRCRRSWCRQLQYLQCIPRTIFCYLHRRRWRNHNWRNRWSSWRRRPFQYCRRPHPYAICWIWPKRCFMFLTSFLNGSTSRTNQWKRHLRSWCYLWVLF